MLQRFLFCLLLLNVLSCTGKKHSGNATAKNLTGKQADSLFRLALHENGITFLIEDLTREEYLQKLSETDTVRNGSIDKWPVELFAPFTFKREEHCIYLPLQNGNTQQFCDSSSENGFSRYTLVGYVKEIHCVCLVNEDNYGQVCLMLNRKDGYVRGFSRFPALSPSRSRYLVSAFDMQAHNGLEIGSMKDSLYARDIAVDAKQSGNWRAASPVWISDDEAVFLRMVKSEDAEHETTRYCHVLIR